MKEKIEKQNLSSINAGIKRLSENGPLFQNGEKVIIRFDYLRDDTVWTVVNHTKKGNKYFYDLSNAKGGKRESVSQEKLKSYKK